MYLLVCQHYIELNPVRAGLVECPANYRWFSYQANGLCKALSLWAPHEIYQQLGVTWEGRAERYLQMFEGQIDMDQLKNIRESLNKGLALGNDRFRKEIEHLTARRVTPLKPGPKPKSKNKEKLAKQELLL